MGTITREELEKLPRQDGVPVKGDYIRIGLSSCGIAAGAQEVFDFILEEAIKRHVTLSVGRCGCSGACYAEPLVEVRAHGLPPVVYGKVTKEIAARILDEHVRDGRPLNDCIVEMLVRR
jgi:NADP-reducing hydrogenase subunit HndB